MMTELVKILSSPFLGMSNHRVWSSLESIQRTQMTMRNSRGVSRSYVSLMEVLRSAMRVVQLWGVALGVVS